jgi:CubicO group peptidase (beta-lactamase class C family)
MRLIALSIAALTLLLCSPAAQAQTDAPWVARHGLTPASYQAEFDRWVGQGYRLTSVSGYEEGAGVRYAAIWERTSGPAWQARHGLTADQYQQTVDALNAQGYRPVQVDGYAVGASVRYAAIFQQDATPWVARHGLTAAQYQAEFDRWVGQGYRLTSVSGYSSNGQARYAAIWQRRGGPAWQARHGLTAAQYQQTFDQLNAQGYHPVVVSGYQVGGVDRYAAIFEAGASPPWVARHSISASEYQMTVDDLRAQGYRPLLVNAHRGPNGTRFATVWRNLRFSGDDLGRIDTAVKQAMAASNTVGLSLAIARRGRLVFAKAYGRADRATNAPLHVDHRLRLASVSKPMTSIEIMRLVEQGRLRLGDRVFGKGSLLGETYGAESAYADPRVKSITVQNLLEHTGGGWDNDGTDGTADPMFIQTGLNQAQLIAWVLKNVKLEYNPGTTYQYSNFGYSVLGRVIERVTGRTYSQTMRSDVFAPAGATSFAIGGDTQAQRLAREPVYYQLGAGAGNPYGMKVARMDAHGGWVATPIDVLRVAVRADGFATVPDRLGAGALATMTTPTTALNPDGTPPNYAKGWQINAVPNWWHTGYLTGTSSLLVRTADRYGPSGTEEFTWAAATNSNNANRALDVDLDTLMWKIVNGVQAWPAHDLF